MFITTIDSAFASNNKFSTFTPPATLKEAALFVSNFFIDPPNISTLASAESKVTFPLKVPFIFIFIALSVDIVKSSEVSAFVFRVIVSPAFAFANTVF